MSRRALAVGAIVLVAGAGGLVLGGRAYLAYLDRQPWPGVGDMIDANAAMHDDWGRNRSDYPQLVMPIDLPEGWSFDRAGGVHESPTGGYILFDFRQESDSRPRPTVTLCLSSTASCPASGEDGSAPLPGSVFGPEQQGVLYGEPDVLDQWRQVRWLSDLSDLNW